MMSSANRHGNGVDLEDYIAAVDAEDKITTATG